MVSKTILTMNIAGLALVLLVVSNLLRSSQSAMLWFEEVPSLDDPCTVVVVSRQHEFATLHPPSNCMETSVAWFGTFGRVHLWIHYGKNETTKRFQEFALCFTAGSPDRVYIWWNNNRNAWSPLSFPIWFTNVTAMDSCRKSLNGTMDLYLEPPWAFPQYMVHVTWNVTFLNTPEEYARIKNFNDDDDDVLQVDE